MLKKDLINRIETFLKKIPPNEEFVDKYFKKLKSEIELGVTECKMLGTGTKADSIILDMVYKDESYRVSIPFKESSIKGLQILNHDDETDIYFKGW